VNAREKSEQARLAGEKAMESAQRARAISDHFSRSPTATSLTSNSQLGEQTDTASQNCDHRGIFFRIWNLRCQSGYGDNLLLPSTSFLSPTLPTIPVPSLSFPFPLFSFLSPPVPSIPLEVGSLKSSLGVWWWSAVSPQSGVWDGSPAEIEFGAF